MEDERNKIGKRISLIGIGSNILLAVIKMLAGLAAGMVSIIADSVNNFSDAAAGIISLIGFKLSSKPADDDHPFGHARFEYLSGLAVAFLVMIAGVELFKSGVDKLRNPEELNLSLVTFIVLIVSIAVKLGMAFMYNRTGKKINSGTVIAAGEDSRNDCISTSAVLISSLVSYFSGYNLDGIMCLLVSLFIIYSGIGLIKETITPLLGTTPEQELVEALEKKIMSYDNVLGTHDLMVHDYGPGHCFASVHVEVPAEKPVLECHEIIDKIELDVHHEMGLMLVIHYDPIVTENEEVSSIRSYLAEEVKKIDESLTVHDLRIVPGEENTNVIFDCVIPASFAKREKEIVADIKHRVETAYPKHTAVIKIDHSFVSLHKS